MDLAAVYNKFDISQDRGGQYTLSMAGFADSYKFLAEQMNTLFTTEQQKYFTNLTLQSFSLDKKSGKVQFRITSAIKFQGITPDSDEILLIGTNRPVEPATASSTPTQ